jgi:hypothetical protein
MLGQVAGWVACENLGTRFRHGRSHADFPPLFRIPSHYQPVLLLTSAVLRKDCSKFWPNRYAHFQAAIPELCDRFFRGRDSVVEQKESPLLHLLPSPALIPIHRKDRYVDKNLL